MKVTYQQVNKKHDKILKIERKLHDKKMIRLLKPTLLVHFFFGWIYSMHEIHVHAHKHAHVHARVPAHNTPNQYDGSLARADSGNTAS